MTGLCGSLGRLTVTILPYFVIYIIVIVIGWAIFSYALVEFMILFGAILAFGAIYAIVVIGLKRISKYRNNLRRGN